MSYLDASIAIAIVLSLILLAWSRIADETILEVIYDIKDMLVDFVEAIKP